MEQFRGRYPIKRQRSVVWMTKSQAIFFGRHFHSKAATSCRGSHCYPPFRCAYLCRFLHQQMGHPDRSPAKTISKPAIHLRPTRKLRSSVEARLDELTYVLSITQEERRLRLDMPDTLANECSTKEIDKCSLPSPDSSCAGRVRGRAVNAVAPEISKSVAEHPDRGQWIRPAHHHRQCNQPVEPVCHQRPTTGASNDMDILGTLKIGLYRG